MKRYLSNYRLEYFKLGNDLQVVLANNPELAVFSMNLLYKVGSKEEQKSQMGIAHLLEHLMFDNVDGFKKGEFDNICSKAGGTNNAYTSFDMTSYTMTLPANQLELGLWLESQRFNNFSINQDNFEIQQKVVIEEINQVINNQPYGKWRDIMASISYTPKSCYSWEVQGSVESVQNLTLSDIELYYKTHYKPDNAVLVLAGGFDIDNAKRFIQKYFGKKNPEPTNKKKIYTSKQYSFFEVFEDNIPHDACFMGFHSSSFKASDAMYGDILANILTNTRSSMVYKDLIHEKQIASQVGSYLDKREESSLFIIYAIGADEKVESNTLYYEMCNNLRGLTNKVTQEMMEKAISNLLTQVAFETMYSHGIADIIGIDVHFYGKYDKIRSLITKYKNANLESLKRYIDKHIDLIAANRVDAKPFKN
jgi:predicted Zn-dependent peptidase